MSLAYLSITVKQKAHSHGASLLHTNLDQTKPKGKKEKKRESSHVVLDLFNDRGLGFDYQNKRDILL